AHGFPFRKFSARAWHFTNPADPGPAGQPTARPCPYAPPLAGGQAGNFPVYSADQPASGTDRDSSSTVVSAFLVWLDCTDWIASQPAWRIRGIHPPAVFRIAGQWLYPRPRSQIRRV